MDISNPTNFRRTVAGAAMIAGPLVILVAEVLHAKFEMDAAKQLARVADNRDRWYAAHVLVLVALALAVPAYFGLVHLFRRARPALAGLSLVVFVPGLVALSAAAGMEFVVWQMAHPVRDTAEMVRLLDRVNESAGLIPLYLFLFLFPVAWLLAGIGLYLARAVPAWVAVLTGVSLPVSFVVEFAGGPKAIVVIAQAAFALGLVPIGLRVLRQSDAEWEEARAASAAPAPEAVS